MEILSSRLSISGNKKLCEQTTFYLPNRLICDILELTVESYVFRTFYFFERLLKF